MIVLVGEFAPTVCRRDTPPSASAGLGRSGRVTPHPKAIFLFMDGVSVAGRGRRAGRGSIAAATRPGSLRRLPYRLRRQQEIEAACPPFLRGPRRTTEPGRLYPRSPRLSVPCGIPKSALLAALRRIDEVLAIGPGQVPASANHAVATPKDGSGANASLFRVSTGTLRMSSAVSTPAMNPGGPQ